MDTGAEEDEGLLAQAEDDDNASGYFYRRKACLPLSTDGKTAQGLAMSARSAGAFSFGNLERRTA